jgi:hypothetical protein
MAGLAGCSAAQPTHVSGVSADKQFASSFTQYDPADASDGSKMQAAKRVGHDLCDSITKEGFDTAIRESVALGKGAGMSSTLWSAVVRAGVDAYCPSYSDDLSKWAADNS